MAIGKYVIEDFSKNWAVNQFQNKILFIKSGEDIRYNKIVSNTINSLTLENQIFTISNNCSYEILDTYEIENSNVNKHITMQIVPNRVVLMPSLTNLNNGDIISIKNEGGTLVLYFSQEFDMRISTSYFSHSSLYLYPLEWIYIVVEKNTSYPNGRYKILTKNFVSKSDFFNPELYIGDNNSRIILNNYYSIYKTNVSNANITYSILSNNIITDQYNNTNEINFELIINLTTVNNITFSNNITWESNTTPIINKIGKYKISFKSIDNGANWVANLIYPIQNNSSQPSGVQTIQLSSPSNVLYNNSNASEMTATINSGSITGIAFQNNIGTDNQYAGKIAYISYARIGASSLEDFVKIRSNTSNEIILERSTYSIPTGDLMSIKKVSVIDQTIIPDVDVTYLFENGEYNVNPTVVELPSVKRNYILNNIKNSMNTIYVSTDSKINAGGILLYYQYTNHVHPYNDSSMLYAFKNNDYNQGEIIWKISGTIDQ